MFGILRTSVFARSAPRVCLLTRGYKKQQNKGQQQGDDESQGDSDPDFQLLDVKIAYSEFMKYWRLPEKPEKLKRTPEQFAADREYIKRYTKLRQEEDAAYRRLFAIKQLQSWEAIFELPPRLFREAVVIDHTVIPTYQPWTDTPPDPNIKLAKPPELPV